MKTEELPDCSQAAIGCRVKNEGILSDLEFFNAAFAAVYRKKRESDFSCSL